MLPPAYAPSHSPACPCLPACPPFVPALPSCPALQELRNCSLAKSDRGTGLPTCLWLGMWASASGTGPLCPPLFIDHDPEMLGPFQRLLVSEKKIIPSLFSASQDQVHQACLEHKLSGHSCLYNLENVLHSGPTKHQGLPDAGMLAGEGAVGCHVSSSLRVGD